MKYYLLALQQGVPIKRDIGNGIALTASRVSVYKRLICVSSAASLPDCNDIGQDEVNAVLNLVFAYSS